MATPHRAITVSRRLLSRATVAGLGAAVVLGIATPAVAGTVSPPQPAAAAVQAAPAAPKAPAVKPPAAKPAPAAAPAPVHPTQWQLMPHGKPTHGQSAVKLDKYQQANAAAIVKAAQEMRLPARAAVIAVATALQESHLHNYGNLGSRNDHDSIGLFQQRPSSGWGSVGQCHTPDHAAKSFLSRLVKVSGWQKLPLTVAAQKVQVSAFGDRYAQWETQAAGIVGQTFVTK